MIILRKIQVALNTFAPPFFNHLVWFWTEKNVWCGNENHERETTETKHMLQLPIYYILEKKISISVNADIAKTKRQK